MIHCESCEAPATRKDACGTALCGRCWSADEPFRGIPPAPQSVIDAGVAVLDTALALYCPECGEPMDEPRKCAACGVARYEPDYDAPRPLTPMENWLRNDEHHQ